MDGVSETAKRNRHGNKVTHRPGRNRFETEENGLTAFLEYLPYDGGLDLIHTIVPGPMQGRGAGAALVRAALEYARTHRLKVIPSCPYVAAYLKRHPEEAELADMTADEIR